MRTDMRATSSAVPPQTTAAPHRSPTERVRHVACRRPKAVRTRHRLDTDAVFHAPMFALNADAEANACEPSRTRSTPTERAQTLRRGYVWGQTHTLMRACACTHSTHTWACRWDRLAAVTRSSIDVARRMDIDTCMYRVDKDHKCVSYMDGPRRASVALARMQCTAVAAARAHKRTGYPCRLYIGPSVAIHIL
jgi:hypothetical protein